MNHLATTTAIADDRTYAMRFAPELCDAFVNDDISHALGEGIPVAGAESTANREFAMTPFEHRSQVTSPPLCEPSSNPIAVAHAQSIAQATQRFYQSNAGRTCQMGGVKSTNRSLARRQYS